MSEPKLKINTMCERAVPSNQHTTQAPTSTARRYDYICVAYHSSGDVYYLTERRTLSERIDKAARWALRELAEGTCVALEASVGYCVYVWAVDFVPHDPSIDGWRARYAP